MYPLGYISRRWFHILQHNGTMIVYDTCSNGNESPSPPAHPVVGALGFLYRYRDRYRYRETLVTLSWLLNAVDVVLIIVYVV